MLTLFFFVPVRSVPLYANDSNINSLITIDKRTITLVYNDCLYILLDYRSFLWKILVNQIKSDNPFFFIYEKSKKKNNNKHKFTIIKTILPDKL